MKLVQFYYTERVKNSSPELYAVQKNDNVFVDECHNQYDSHKPALSQFFVSFFNDTP